LNNKEDNTIGIYNKGKGMNNKMLPIDLPFGNEHDKYRGAAIRWLDETDHYELIFTDDFVTPSSNSQKYGKATGGIFSWGGVILF
jgi:hypothetical protein